MSAEYNIYKKEGVVSNCCSAGIEENSGRCLQCLEHCEPVEVDLFKDTMKDPNPMDGVDPLVLKLLEPFIKPLGK